MIAHISTRLGLFILFQNSNTELLQWYRWILSRVGKWKDTYLHVCVCVDIPRDYFHPYQCETPFIYIAINILCHLQWFATLNKMSFNTVRFRFCPGMWHFFARRYNRHHGHSTSSKSTSCNGSVQRHQSLQACWYQVSVPISSDINTLVPRLLSHIFNHLIFIAI